MRADNSKHKAAYCARGVVSLLTASPHAAALTEQAAKVHALEQAQAKASQQASMDSMDSLIAPAVARALSRMKSRPATGRSVAGLVDVVDDGEERELSECGLTV